MSNQISEIGPYPLINSRSCATLNSSCAFEIGLSSELARHIAKVPVDGRIINPKRHIPLAARLSWALHTSRLYGVPSTMLYEDCRVPNMLNPS